MIRDVEDLIESLRTYVKANLNTKINVINTEKSDEFDIDLIPVSDDHYVLSAELQDLPNHIFANFSISDITPVPNRGNLAINTEIIIEIAFDNPKKAGTSKKSLRYMRALYETVNEYGFRTSEVSGMEITTLKPMIVTMTNRQLIVSGVSVSCGISN